MTKKKKIDVTQVTSCRRHLKCIWSLYDFFVIWSNKTFTSVGEKGFDLPKLRVLTVSKWFWSLLFTNHLTLELSLTQPFFSPYAFPPYRNQINQGCMSDVVFSCFLTYNPLSASALHLIFLPRCWTLSIQLVRCVGYVFDIYNLIVHSIGDSKKEESVTWYLYT